MAHRRPERILVVKLATLGDLLTITPALRALRTTFPQAHIGVLTTPGSGPALRGLDTFDEVITFDKFAFDRPSDALRSLPSAARLARDLRSGAWDTLVLLHHLTTAFGIAKYAALALGSGAKRRIGLDNGRGRFFLTEAAEDRGFGWRHEVDYWLSVVSVLGAQHPGRPRLELCVTADDDGWAATRWTELRARDAVLLAPGSGAYSRARRWAPERFAAVGQSLFDRRGMVPLVLSGLEPDEVQLAQEVATLIGPVARVAPAAPGPQALAALLRRCRIVVSNDSGVVHVATTVGTPVVAIFGPSNDRAWGPYPPDDSRHQVVREAVACAPCIHRGHSFGTPQGCPARTCLAIVEPGQVIAAAERAVEAQAVVPA
jgi:heptosyltransferase-2